MTATSALLTAFTAAVGAVLTSTSGSAKEASRNFSRSRRVVNYLFQNDVPVPGPCFGAYCVARQTEEMPECYDYSHCPMWPCFIGPDCVPELRVEDQCWVADCTATPTTYLVAATAVSTALALLLLTTTIFRAAWTRALYWVFSRVCGNAYQPIPGHQMEELNSASPSVT